jgi:hypothetical protein
MARAQDAFNRVVPLGPSWGTSDHGGGWTADVSLGNYYSCSDGLAHIDETTTGATWEQVLDVTRRDYDLQVRVSWDDVPATQGPLQPLILIGRRQDRDSYYQAELRQDASGTLALRLGKKIDGVSTALGTANLGGHVAGSWWYVRFQLDGSHLRAKAWPESGTQPTAWTVTADDVSISTGGKVSIRSSNSSSDARPTVSFEGFRVHTLGLTIHAWMKPDGLTFDGDPATDNYIHWLGKGEADDWEYAFRFYSLDSERPNRISAYIFNLVGGRGAGAYSQAEIADQQWIQIVGVFDPGDRLDTRAGATIYKNGQFVQGPPSPGTLYSNGDFLVHPLNGRAPLRFGTASKDTFFNGWLDEIAIFDRKLTLSEIRMLHASSQ